MSVHRYDSPRRHLLQGFSLVQDILSRRAREQQQLSDREYDELRTLCMTAPLQPQHARPFSAANTTNSNNDNNISTTGSDDINRLKREFESERETWRLNLEQLSAELDRYRGAAPPSTAAAATAGAATFAVQQPQQGHQGQPAEPTPSLQRQDSMLNRPLTESDVRKKAALAKLRQALGLGNALALSADLATSRDEASALANFAVSCSALTASPVKILQLLVEHMKRFLPGDVSPRGKAVTTSIYEGEFLVDPINGTLIASDQNPVQALFDEKRRQQASSTGAGGAAAGGGAAAVAASSSSTSSSAAATSNIDADALFIYDARLQTAYISIEAENERFGFVEIRLQNEISRQRMTLMAATASCAALALRTSWQLEHQAQAARKSQLLLKMANSITSETFASEAEVISRLTIKSKDLCDAQYSFFFRVPDKVEPVASKKTAAPTDAAAAAEAAAQSGAQHSSVAGGGATSGASSGGGASSSTSAAAATSTTTTTPRPPSPADSSPASTLLLFHKGDLLRLRRQTHGNDGRGSFTLADTKSADEPDESGDASTVAGGGQTAAEVAAALEADETLRDETLLAALVAEQVVRTNGQVLQLSQGSIDSTGDAFVPCDLATIARQGLGSRTGSHHNLSSALRRHHGGRSSCAPVMLPESMRRSGQIRINSLLGIPVLNDTGAVIAVLVFANKHPRRLGKIDSPQLFNQSDIDILLQLSSLTSISLANSRAATRLQSEKRTRDATLSVISHLNECDIRNVDEVVRYVMHGAKRLLNADRSTLFLIDEERDELFSTVADAVGNKVIRFPVGRGIAGRVALTGQPEVIRDAYRDDRFNQEIDRETGYRTLSILALPVVTKGDTVAVAQLINKLDGHGRPIAFTHEDQELLGTFCMFAGIAISNSRLLEFTMKAGQEAMALNNYDGGSPAPLSRKGTQSLLGAPSQIQRIPATDIEHVKVALVLLAKLIRENEQKYSPVSRDFDLFALKDEAKDSAAARDLACAAIVHLFVHSNFHTLFRVDEDVLICFVLQCRKMYRFVPYHNFFHAVDACQTMYTFLFAGGARELITELETFVMLVTALVHDLDHMGLNNSYHLKTDSPLGILSAVSGNNSVLEVHHCNIAIEILTNSGDANVFGGLNKDDSAQAYRQMLSCVLATDMARHGDLLKAYDSMCEDGFDRAQEAHRLIAMQMLMKAADISNVTKPFHISRQWAVAVTEEFYQQGDKERASGLQVVPMNDRTLGTELAKGQLGFINFVANKFFTSMHSKLFTGFQFVIARLRSNKERWEEIMSEG